MSTFRPGAVLAISNTATAMPVCLYDSGIWSCCSGYFRDAESGNDYAVNRYQSPGMGRFMTADKINGHPSDPGSWNKYAYAGGDPINLHDPEGTDACPDDDPCTPDDYDYCAELWQEISYITDPDGIIMYNTLCGGMFGYNTPPPATDPPSSGGGSGNQAAQIGGYVLYNNTPTKVTGVAQVENLPSWGLAMNALNNPGCLQAIGAENSEIAEYALANIYNLQTPGVYNTPNGTSLLFASTNQFYGEIYLSAVFYDPQNVMVNSPTFGNVSALEYMADLYNLPNLTTAQLQAIVLLHEAGHVIEAGFPNDVGPGIPQNQSEINTGTIITACYSSLF